VLYDRTFWWWWELPIWLRWLVGFIPLGVAIIYLFNNKWAPVWWAIGGLMTLVNIGAFIWEITAPKDREER
jgi:hypothetical protein